MPCIPRFVVPGLPLHVFQRGHNRQVIFFTDQDYDRFHADLLTASKRFDCVIHLCLYDKPCAFTCDAERQAGCFTNDVVSRTSVCTLH
jgi:hypothetical protein